MESHLMISWFSFYFLFSGSAIWLVDSIISYRANTQMDLFVVHASRKLVFNLGP